jgi:hypothetical protein
MAFLLIAGHFVPNQRSCGLRAARRHGPGVLIASTLI